MQDISKKPLPEEEKENPNLPKKKSGVYKFFLFANLMTIPALAFYFYVGLGGHINGYFLLVVFMVLSEYYYTRKFFK